VECRRIWRGPLLGKEAGRWVEIGLVGAGGGVQ